MKQLSLIVILLILISAVIALRPTISSPSFSTVLASKNSFGNDEEPEVLKEKLQLDLSQLKPFLKIAVPFFREDKPARDSVSEYSDGLKIISSE